MNCPNCGYPVMCPEFPDHDDELFELRQFYDRQMRRQEDRMLPVLSRNGNSGYQTVVLWDERN